MTRRLAIAAAALSLILLGGCAKDSEPTAEEGDSQSVQTVEDAEESTQADSLEEEESPESAGFPVSEEHLGDVLAERDQFIEDQKQPLGQELLTPQTPEQQTFIDEQRAYVESQGGTWTPEAESIALALSLDACETSILNSHDLDTVDVQTHIATSPLFAAMIPADYADDVRAQAEANISSVMISGVSYLCPNDFEQWKLAFDELYGEHVG